MAKRNQTILAHFIRDYNLEVREPNDVQIHEWSNYIATYYSRYHRKAFKPLYDLLMTAREVVKMERLLDE
ncbi:hypothetical protein NVP1152O_092 [Vibrio phage 1.152.O._10N.222.46.E1]|uniref:Uncharacterized protein n=5 Tax=Nahantvirus 49C7 TaxID=2846601 RepID=A0A2I7RBI4_9CAUD|nr:hypothetical protein HYP57_gp094 [Vibrio phage 1.026.O._10N.222.49.C7]AUR82574.1 hypothetical protein NVP1025O_091 [Vibrio phage 1.025.O._10N.222.46.B6]AUR90824.1 hypothetical protein NVP1150O_091 [Vibrio phage 1.150.O._10N.222.46.A6]AUR90997.1 hypothetical protein NVP1152O_092 [Vibrio phage 1.152.O._10N.222.46.E1]AUS02465.1 hypothetical protein NVP2130O_091 [Vibrio phage 2.130.O._10N.222.46.C2]AUR82682.1 hypothetical protein NVP1026O_091 [Vibrio phage 1.026.O._10N.222.49.C7]